MGVWPAFAFGQAPAVSGPRVGPVGLSVLPILSLERPGRRGVASARSFPAALGSVVDMDAGRKGRFCLDLVTS